MSRIEEALHAARAAGRSGLIPFLTAGDPEPGETPGLIAALAEAGADVIELGVPYSDPVADGPVIQRSSERALRRGVTLERVLEIVQVSRSRTTLPIVLFGYVNSFLAFGLPRFAREAPAAGVDGVLLTDLPFEEGHDLRAIVRAAGMDTIQLASPTSGPERLSGIAAASSGFVYCIARAGVTGPRDSLPEGLPALIASVRGATRLPVAVGFGISTPEHVRALSGLADAVVVGSALVAAIASATATGSRLIAARDFLAPLAAAL